MIFPLGTSGSNKDILKLDFLKLVNSRAIVQANSGGGKSWLFRVIAEQTAGKVQTIIIDSEGEFATLREKFDFALIGDSGEMPIDLRSAALLARKLIEFNISAIVNLSDLPDLEQKREYLAVFLVSLMSVPQKFWHPVILMLDEAHKFCPEKGDVKSTRAVITLMDSGRKRGFAGVLATQRLSKLHKDAAAEANNVFVGRTWLDLDQERAGDLLGMRKADRLVLRDLAPGEFFAFGPALEANGVVRFLSAPVQTTHPKPGERHTLVVPRASEAIREIITQIGDLPAQAEQEENRLAGLLKENADLRLKLSQRPAPEQVPRRIERIEIPVFRQGELSKLEGVEERLQTDLQDLESFLQKINLAIASANSVPKQIIDGIPENMGPSPLEKIVPIVRVKDFLDSQSDIEAKRFPKAESKILRALAQYPQGRTKAQVAVLTGYAVKGGGFNNAVGSLRSSGLLNSNGDSLCITQSGITALGVWEPLPTGQALYEHWRQQLPKAEQAILNVLVRAWPVALTKEVIARETGYQASGGGFNNALGKLRTLELIDGRVEIKASDNLF